MPIYISKQPWHVFRCRTVRFDTHVIKKSTFSGYDSLEGGGPCSLNLSSKKNGQRAVERRAGTWVYVWSFFLLFGCFFFHVLPNKWLAVSEWHHSEAIVRHDRYRTAMVFLAIWRQAGPWVRRALFVCSGLQIVSSTMSK